MWGELCNTVRKSMALPYDEQTGAAHYRFIKKLPEQDTDCAAPAVFMSGVGCKRDTEIERLLWDLIL